MKSSTSGSVNFVWMSLDRPTRSIRLIRTADGTSEDRGPGPGGTQQIVVGGGSALGSNLLPFYIPFFTKNATPFEYLLSTKDTKFTYLV